MPILQWFIPNQEGEFQSIDGIAESVKVSGGEFIRIEDNPNFYLLQNLSLNPLMNRQKLTLGVSSDVIERNASSGSRKIKAGKNPSSNSYFETFADHLLSGMTFAYPVYLGHKTMNSSGLNKRERFKNFVESAHIYTFCFSLEQPRGYHLDRPIEVQQR